MTIYIPFNKKVTIPIGICGENIVTELAFDVSDWLEEYGDDSTIRLLLQRPTDTAAYPCTMTIEDGYAVYKPTSADCQYIGNGKAELRLTNGSMVAKSKIYPTIIMASLDGTGTVPSVWQTWMDTFEDLVDRAEEAAETAQLSKDMTASASVDANSGTPSVTVTRTEVEDDDDSSHYNFNFAFKNLKGAGLTVPEIVITASQLVDGEITFTNEQYAILTNDSNYLFRITFPGQSSWFGKYAFTFFKFNKLSSGTAAFDYLFISLYKNNYIGIAMAEGEQVGYMDSYETASQEDVDDKLDASKCTFQSTAPTAAITDGGVHIVYLASEPARKYSGYIYLIAEA